MGQAPLRAASSCACPFGICKRASAEVYRDDPSLRAGCECRRHRRGRRFPLAHHLEVRRNRPLGYQTSTSPSQLRDTMLQIRQGVVGNGMTQPSLKLEWLRITVIPPIYSRPDHSSGEPCCVRTCMCLFSLLVSVLMAMLALLICALTGNTRYKPRGQK